MVQSTEMQPTHLVRVVDFHRLWDCIDRTAVRRVVDIGCHRGEHILGVLRPIFPDAEIVGIEPKIANFKKCMELKTGNLNFYQLDCRTLRKNNVGVFDFVWCAGLIYHLDDPTKLMESLQSITHHDSYVCIEGHIASEGQQACFPAPNPPIISQVLDGELYYGKMFPEFSEKASLSEREALYWASLDNPWSFWLTYPSIVKMFIKYGFKEIIELRSTEPTRPLGPDLIYAPVDQEREWSRRMFLISRASMNDWLREEHNV